MPIFTAQELDDFVMKCAYTQTADPAADFAAHADQRSNASKRKNTGRQHREESYRASWGPAVDARSVSETMAPFGQPYSKIAGFGSTAMNFGKNLLGKAKASPLGQKATQGFGNVASRMGEKTKGIRQVGGGALALGGGGMTMLSLSDGASAYSNAISGTNNFSRLRGQF